MIIKIKINKELKELLDEYQYCKNQPRERNGHTDFNTLNLLSSTKEKIGEIFAEHAILSGYEDDK